MKRPPFFLIVLGILAFIIGRAPAGLAQGIERCLPVKSQLGSWRPFGDPQTVQGEDLYMLINGGAEIVLEYGFESAVLHSYENDSGKSLNLEIYMMTSPAGAYGLYTFRRGRKGTVVPVGNEGFLQGYYLNFWKGNALVTVIGFDTDEETKRGVMHMGRAVADRIKEPGQVPASVDLLLKEGLDPLSIKFIRGNLGLYNLYDFDTANIFGLTEGILGEYGDIKFLMITYEDEEDRTRWYSESTQRLSQNDRFTAFRRTDTGVFMKDRQGRHVHLQPFGRTILCGIGPDRESVKALLQRQRAHIASFQEVP